MLRQKIEWKVEKTDLPDKPPALKTKKKQVIIVLCFAFISTFFQFLFFRSCVGSFEESVVKNVYAVAVAKSNVKSGQILTTDDVKMMYLDVGAGKEHYILNSELDRYWGRKIVVDLKENSPILKNVFMSDFQKNSVPEKIPPGKRLYVLNTRLGNIASLLHVGDRIDVLAHLDIPEFGKATETVLEGAEIIGIGEHLEENGQGRVGHGDSLSFYLSPEEVKILSFMQQYAEFSVVLRNPNDKTVRSADAVTFNRFMEDERIQHIIKNDSFRIIQGKKLKNDLENKR